ncbi:MAG: 4Fe-4S dicluster domain-containing protein [Desulfobacteraceae bacterium]|jgi:putative selenate reductase YgfK subunit|nr:MAG: 4Fe-4S dicluster domain-containing protein [Desulfobacteraceae bacterium]
MKEAQTSNSAQCPVKETRAKLFSMLEGGGLPVARFRRWGEEIITLLDDIINGRAGRDHLITIESLARRIAVWGEENGCSEWGKTALDAVYSSRELFESHIRTRNCPVTDCVVLTPAPCQTACPAGIDVPGYVTLVGLGNDEEAIELIRKDNPFPWVCGLICTNPCEFMCVRGRMDKPISIKYLKAFAAERAISQGRYKNPYRETDNEQKVCVIGAGPAGMTAAYYLAIKGYGVTVIESLPMAGGMMMVGIPRYRLPREVIDREVAMLEELGVEFRFNTSLGRDVSIEKLRNEGFSAFLISIGAHASHKMAVPGEENFPQVTDAIQLLKRVAMGDRRMPGRRVAVVGGGNVAMDAARTSIRLGCEEVTVVYRRTHAEMPANREEVEQAEEEGVRFLFLTVPVEVVGREGKVTALKCIRTELSRPDESGRRRPVPVEGSDFILEVDAVIPAIGQAVESACLDEIPELSWSRRKTITVKGSTMESSLEGIFAAGDAVTGPATVVEAIGGGKRAAEAIDRYLSGIPQPELPPVPVRRTRLPVFETSASEKTKLSRPEMPLLNRDRRRITFQQVELGFDEKVARNEAKRCLRCDICVRCGRCVDICRNQMKVDALRLGYLSANGDRATDLRITAERCILCGACAANCPTGAMRIEDRGDERILSLCGTILNRMKMERCAFCGEVLGPERYHDFIRKNVIGIAPPAGDKPICSNCARRRAAAAGSEAFPAGKPS